MNIENNLLISYNIIFINIFIRDILNEIYIYRYYEESI